MSRDPRARPPNVRDRAEIRSRRLVLFALAMLFAAVCFMRGASPHSAHLAAFLDPDSAMRLVQVLDLRAGAGWYELTQRRLNPPAGVPMHWSRLPDLPLLAVLAISEPLIGRQAGIALAAAIVPPLLGVLYFSAFVWAVAPLVAFRLLPLAGLVCLAIVFPPSRFAAGQVDHHGWQLVLAMVAAGTLVRVALGLPSFRALIVAGVAGALGLWVGAEGIPPIALVTAALTLYWTCRGGQDAAGVLLIYGAALICGVLLVYPVALAPKDWRVVACDAFSLLSLGLALTVLVFGIGLVLLERVAVRMQTAGRRMFAALALGGGLVAVLAVCFPDCALGPYGRLSVETQALVNGVTEAQPMSSLIVHWPALAAFCLALPVLALALTLWRLLVAAPAERMLWQSLSILIAGGILLMFWQVRTAILANAYAGMALCWWAARWIERSGACRLMAVRAMIGAVPLLTIFLLPVLLLLGVGAMAGGGHPHVLHACRLSALAPALNGPRLMRNGPLLIAAPTSIGPAILLETPHRVLAAPYHRDVGGLRAIKAILGGDPDRARRVSEARGVDLVYVCGEPGNLIARSSPNRPTLFERLQAGEPPEWLIEIPLLSAAEGEHLYRRVGSRAACD